VINLVSIGGDACTDPSVAGVEAVVSDKFLGATLMTRVAANRMRLTLSEGLILNVAICAGDDDRARAFADVVRATLAALTRGEAAEWAVHGIRINAIAPSPSAAGAGSPARAPSGADIAALALYLASDKGRGLSGQVFDAEGVAARRC
jgi:3-oxoacyl-[acyl-carrier protein] reductase